MTNETTRRGLFNGRHQDAFGKPLYRNIRTLLCASAASLALCCSASHADDSEAHRVPTRTPIKHLVVIFNENHTFDNYFGTYPNAANIPGEQGWIGVPAPVFHARPDTPKANNYLTNPDVFFHNPNVTATGAQANPIRLRPADAYGACGGTDFGVPPSYAGQSLTDYTGQEIAIDGGRMDKFIFGPQNINGCKTDGSMTLGYWDGNTVTALWNYAQHYALSDEFYNTVIGGSMSGHFSLVAGNNHGAVLHGNAPANVTNKGYYTNPVDGSVTVIDVFDAYLDDCSLWAAPGGYSAELTGRNVGDLLNAKRITWGWFAGGFKPTQPAVLNPDGSTKTPAVCGASHTAHEFTIDGTTYVVPNPTINFLGDIHVPQTDGIQDASLPFQYYASTRNPHHLPPSSVVAIGRTDQANHQYDVSDFLAALNAGNFPSVSFLKPAWYAVGHPGISDPLTEQAQLVQLINQIMMTPEWESTAIVITWDDFGGWYDHVAPPVLDPSNTPVDFHCGNGKPAPGDGYARCRLGLRMPALVISPWAKHNHVDHTVTEQTSILRFIEDNWGLGFIDGPTPLPPGTESFDRYVGSIGGMFDFDREPNIRPLILDPIRGTVVKGESHHDD
jgi:phospholipase C